jgi:phage gpG-like protein
VLLMDLQLDGLIEFEVLEQRWDFWWPARALVLFGEALEEDTRLRLEDDVVSPKGQRWDEWSEDYAKTRGPQHKLLYGEGDLARSMTADRNGDVLGFGSSLPYAEVHQSGSRDGRLSAREYVGVSRELGRSLDSIFGSDFERGW